MTRMIASGLVAALVVSSACTSGGTGIDPNVAAPGTSPDGSGQPGTVPVSTPAGTAPTCKSDGVVRYQQWQGVLSYRASGKWDQAWTVTASCGQFSGTLTTPGQPAYSVTGTYDDAGKVLTFVTSPALPASMDFTVPPVPGTRCTYGIEDKVGLICPDGVYALTDPVAAGPKLTLGNPSCWKNHGEYVSSVAKDPKSTPAQVKAAAQSCIGNPVTGGGGCPPAPTWSKGTLSYTIGGSQMQEWAITVSDDGRFFGFLAASNPVLPNGVVVGTYDPKTRTVLGFVTTQPEQYCQYYPVPPVALLCPSYPGYPAPASGRFLTTNTSFDQPGQSGVNFTLTQDPAACIQLPVCQVHDD